VEHEALLEALRQSGGNKARAARLLGIHRATIYSRMRHFKIVDG